MRKRIFHSDNGVLKELTVNLDNYHSGQETIDFVAAEDYLFIGTILPLNHLFYKFGTNKNTNDSTIDINVWNGDEWKAIANIVDETKVGNKSMAQDGFIQWVPNKNYGWAREDTNYGGNTVDGLETVEIYDQYWHRVSFSADLSTIDLSWLGQKFCNDDDLSSEYEDLVRTDMLTAFKANKTNWEKEIVRASEFIVEDIKARNIVLEKEQILNRFDFRLACVSKLAEIIYGGLGDDYRDDKKDARADYTQRLGMALPKVDKNRNARLDTNERPVTGRLTR